MIQVLTIDSEHDSAKRLGYDTITDPEYYEDYTNDLVIRWGNSSHIFDANYDTHEFDKVINPREAIARNCHKNKAIKLIGSVVTAPTCWEEGEKVPAGV